MVQFSRGLILIIIGIILFIPGSIVFQIILPFPLGIGATFLVTPSFFIAGVIFVIIDRNASNGGKKLNSPKVEICKNCGNEISFQDSLCTRCGKQKLQKNQS
jgi:hypothetical protein